MALLIARLLAQRLNVATTYLADLMHQYGGHGDHLSMVGELLQSMINLPPSQVSPGSDRQSDSQTLERFRAKWIPVRVKKTRQNKKLEPGSDFIKAEKALAALG